MTNELIVTTVMNNQLISKQEHTVALYTIQKKKYNFFFMLFCHPERVKMKINESGINIF